MQDDTFVGTRWRVTGNFPLLFFVMAYPSATILKWKIKNKKHYFKILVSKCTLRQTFSLFTFFSQYCKHTKNINILKKKKKMSKLCVWIILPFHNSLREHQFLAVLAAVSSGDKPLKFKLGPPPIHCLISDKHYTSPAYCTGHVTVVPADALMWGMKKGNTAQVLWTVPEHQGVLGSLSSVSEHRLLSPS